MEGVGWREGEEEKTGGEGSNETSLQILHRPLAQIYVIIGHS